MSVVLHHYIPIKLHKIVFYSATDIFGVFFFFCSFEDITSLSDSTSLSEISLDGNPITQEQYYKQIVLRHMQQLKQLDMKRVTVSRSKVTQQMVQEFSPFY